MDGKRIPSDIMKYYARKFGNFRRERAGKADAIKMFFVINFMFLNEVMHFEAGGRLHNDRALLWCGFFYVKNA